MIFLMPIYFIIALVVIYKLMKHYQGQHKWRRFLLLAFLFYLPVGWDVILGRSYFQYLCYKDGGIHIYQTVELGSEYWNEDGSPKFYTERGAFDSSVFDGRYVFEQPDDRYTTKRAFNIVKYTRAIIDTTIKQVMGEWVIYEYLGGWVNNTGTPFGKSSIQCHRSSDTSDNPAITGINLTTSTGVILRIFSKFTSYIFLRKDDNDGDKK